MDWRALLTYDLRRLLPGYRALPEPPPDGEAVSFEHYPRSARKNIYDPAWKGPRYTFPRQWEVELLFLLEQIRLCTRANLPLHQGLDAAARNEFQSLQAHGPGYRVRASAGLLLVIAVFVAFAAAVLFAPFRGVLAPAAFIGAGMLGTGILDGALRRSRRAAVCGSLVHAMNRGLTLSEAMARLSTFFPKPVVSMVEVGETTGRLAETVEQVNKDVLRRFVSNQQFSGWVAYFLAVVVIQVTVIFFLLYKVAPVIQEILDDLRETSFGQGVPPAEREIPFPLPLPSLDWLVNVPGWMMVNLAVLGLAGLAVLAGLAWRRLAAGGRLDRWSGSDVELYLPVYRALLARQNLAMVANILARLLKAGVPLDRALLTLAESGLHPAYAAWIHAVRDRILQGESLGDACIMAPCRGAIPRSFHDAVAMGEQQGRPEDGLAYIGEQYAEDVHNRIQWWQSCAQIGAILVLGYVVLSIEAGVFGVILDIAEAIGP